MECCSGLDDVGGIALFTASGSRHARWYTTHFIQITDLQTCCRLRSMAGARLWRTIFYRSRAARSVAVLRTRMLPVSRSFLRQQITVPFGQTSAWSRQKAALVQHISAFSLKVLSLPAVSTRCLTHKRQETIWCNFFSHVWSYRGPINPASGAEQVRQLKLLDGVVASPCHTFHIVLPRTRP